MNSVWAYARITIVCRMRCVLVCSCAVYDITKRSSFISIQKWIEEVRRYTASSVMLILVGNKCDLEAEREVTIRNELLLLTRRKRGPQIDRKLRLAALLNYPAAR